MVVVGVVVVVVVVFVVVVVAVVVVVVIAVLVLGPELELALTLALVPVPVLQLLSGERWIVCLKAQVTTNKFIGPVLPLKKYSFELEIGIIVLICVW